MHESTQDSTRLWLGFAVTSVIFVVVLAISPFKDYLREYRSYFNEYRSRLLESAGSAKELREARAQTLQIRQIWIPEFGDRVDRCETCHLGVENPKMADAPEPYRMHPSTPHTPDDFQTYGCVVCHRGQGRATTVAEAHGNVEDWDSPLLPLVYTEASCGQCHLADKVPEASLLSAGRALMDKVGCYACHELTGHEDWKSVAPDLNGLAQKTYPEWLMAWLASPSTLQPETWMPDFHLTPDEAHALVAFLLTRPPAEGTELNFDETLPEGDPGRGRKIFRQTRCISCHTVDGRGNGSAPELGTVGSKVDRRWLIAFLGDPHAFQPETLMPRYDFDRQDLLDLSQYLVDELYDPEAPARGEFKRTSRKEADEGEALFKKYGCGSCHRVAGIENPGRIGPELTGIGDKSVVRLDFGRRDDLPRRLPDWLAAKVSDPRSFREGLKMPDFGFSPEQMTQLVTALLSASAAQIPADDLVPAQRASYVPPGHFGDLVDRYRCLSCHRIAGTGGDISTAPLTMEGSRVKPEWLEAYLRTPSTIRPILTDRMVRLQMPREDSEFLTRFFQDVFVDNRIERDPFGGGPAAPERVERGRRLFYERFGCQGCHMVGGEGGYYGPLLDGASERLRAGWVAWWLRGPQQWRDDVRCPDYGLDETDATDLAAFVTSIPAQGAAGAGGSR